MHHKCDHKHPIVFKNKSTLNKSIIKKVKCELYTTIKLSAVKPSSETIKTRKNKLNTT